ncbi:hypothetical protein C5167_012366 [Papaver somniferum]|uniref:Uncharacterized protein n=1 Tax=Papaver somniferum TaxID=3469 RepID=A0A4Y7IY28_PAPSO|nr:hypothetical protein C5167_012366 [Papaver somniferum]
MIYDVNSTLFRSFLSQKGGADKRRMEDQPKQQRPKANENKPVFSLNVLHFMVLQRSSQPPIILAEACSASASGYLESITVVNFSSLTTLSSSYHQVPCSKRFSLHVKDVILLVTQFILAP